MKKKIIAQNLIISKNIICIWNEFKHRYNIKTVNLLV